ncbi:MAG: FtsW/RodA/SpoVE family cell cycle protein, partial [Clostridia bacterium]|nr:FtsW/RodA/SpoVE family cell cycle protein [Clostridia bacterium]
MEKLRVKSTGREKKSPVNKLKNSLSVQRKPKQVQRLRSGIDWPFAILVLVLLSIGTIFVFSSSYVYAKFNYDNSYFFISKQVGWVIFSLVILIAIIRYFDYLLLKRLAIPAFIASYVLLWCVFFFGADANGAKRWIYLGGFSVQPSEIIKFTVILLIAAYAVWLDTKGPDLIRTFKFGVLPFGVLAVLIAFPLILQPHLSATIIILALIFIMMFLTGTKRNYLISAAIVCGVLMLMIALFTSHGQARIDSWLHPENDIQGAGWQPLQSLYAIGSGGLWGVGLGGSKQK